METGAAPAATRLACGALLIDLAERVVLVDGAPARLSGRAFDVLAALVARRDRVVSKNELFDVVWPGLVVEENNLQVHVSALRKLFGPQAIATVPGRGYRFMAPLEVSGAATAPPPPKPVLARGNLTTELASLIGRDADVADLHMRLAADSLVTLVGPGGIGKTRLALAVAREHAERLQHGAWLVDLSPLEDPAQLAALVANALAIDLSADQPAEATIAAALRAQELLLVLDNCEHVLDAVAALVLAVRSRAPRVRVLATSREPLRLAGEQVVRLDPLALPPAAEALSAEAAVHYGAVALFVARAQAADRRFALSRANVAAVSALCRQLDGLPLAIELAAARVPLLGIDGLLERLGDRLRVLGAAGRGAPARQQTLRATLDWSHALLEAGEQAVFRRLGVFVGGFSVELAQAVATDATLDAWNVLDHVGALIDKSLVIADGEPPRYRLLETTREFALEQLAAKDELDPLRRRHAEALAARLADFDGAVATAPRFDVLVRPLAAEFDNLHAALGWAVASPDGLDLALTLAGSGDWLWNEYDRYREGLQWCEHIAARLDGEHGVGSGAAPAPEHVARFRLAHAGLSRVSLKPPGVWMAMARRALADCRAAGYRIGIYRALCLLSGPGGERTDLDDVGHHLEEAAALEDPAWAPRLRLRRQNALEWWHDVAGRLPEALEASRAHVALARQAGGAVLIGALCNLSDSEFSLGNVDTAVALVEEAIELAEQLGRPAGVFHAYGNIVPALLQRGDVAHAERAIRMGRALFVRSVGTAFMLLVPAALLAQQRGEADLAARLIGCADRLYAVGGYVLHPPEQRMREKLFAGLRASPALPADRLLALQAEGAGWSEDEAFAHAGLA